MARTQRPALVHWSPGQLWERAALWLLVRLHHSRPLGASAGHHRITMLTWRRGLDVGVLDYQLCHACRVGCVNKISITPEYQRKGLGRWAVRHALARGRGYAWVTTGKPPEGKAYFAEMARQSGAAFAQRVGSCAHTEVR